MLMILYSTEKNARHISFSLLSSLTVHDTSAVVVSELPVQFSHPSMILFHPLLQIASSISSIWLFFPLDVCS
jgi:hypothetical protein